MLHITLRPHPRKLTQKSLLKIVLCKLPQITLQNLSEGVTLDRALHRAEIELGKTLGAGGFCHVPWALHLDQKHNCPPC
jgi:hypothetical protein